MNKIIKFILLPIFCIQTVFGSPDVENSAKKYDVIVRKAKFYDENSKVAPKAIIMHCMGLSFEEAFKILLGEGGYQVSAHYLVPQYTGQELKEKFPDLFAEDVLEYPERVPVIHFVPEDKVAYHAGVSAWMAHAEDGAAHVLSGLNRHTIGIEFHAPEYASQFLDSAETERNFFHFGAFHPAQIETGISLIQDILEKNKIDSKAILAHADIAAYRTNNTGKTDPGPLFPWQQFAEQGIGLVLQPLDTITKKEDFSTYSYEQKVEFCKNALEQIGYYHGVYDDEHHAHEHLKANVIAFIMHFMPSQWKDNLQKSSLEDLLTEEILEGMQQSPCLWLKIS